MNGLKASPGGRISSALRDTAPLQLFGASNCANYDECNSEEESLEGFIETEDGCDHPPLDIESDVPNSNDHNEQVVQEVTQADRDVHTFFERFLPHSSPESSKPLQPITVLQSRYDTLQHQLNKIAQVKSMREWFRDESWGKSNDLWWTSEIVIPIDIAAMWGLKSVHSSGQFQLTPSEMEALKEGNDGKDPLDLCGEFKLSSTNMIQFKSKKGARKCAALNLLLTMDLGDLPNVEYDLKKNGQLVPNEVVMEDGVSISNNGKPLSMPKERFQLESINYYGAVKHSEGEVLSLGNPCMVQCVVSVKDNKCNDLNQHVLEVTSEFHHHEDDSLKATFDTLGPKLMDRGATANEVHNVFSSMKESKPGIAYAMAFPKWSTAKVESQLYLYELEFYFEEEGNAAFTPLSEAMGLDANVATRMGIICGCDLYEGRNFEKELCADFKLASSICTVGSSGNVRVRMCSRTEVTLSEMIRQIERASPKINLQEGEGPITLMKCFNIILFDHGKIYGLGPKLVWDDLIKRLDEDKAESGNHRTYLFLPLHAHRSNLEINWRLVWDVVHHNTKCVLSLSGSGVSLPTSFFKQISLVLSLVGSMACGIAIFSSVARCYTDWDHYLLQRNDWTFIPLLLILFAVSISTTISVTKTIPSSLLHNHFLSQPTGFKKRLFIGKDEGPNSTICVMSLAPLLWHNLKIMLRELYAGLRLSNAKYYKHLWQCYIRHPMEPLIPALLVNGVSYAHHELTLFHQIYGKTCSIPTSKTSSQSSISNLLAARGLLVPELTQILPMPRDMLYLCQHASIFMHQLERTHTLTIVASRLREVQHNTGRSLHCKTIPADNILPFIDKATSICNNTNTEDPALREHERLETLGDSILLFFIVLNLFAKKPSSDVSYVLDMFERVICLQGKNEVLFKAAMQVGLQRLVHVGNVSSTKSWRSIYKTTPKGPTASFTQTMELSRKQMSNIVESVLGATILIDPTGCMTVGFLNEIGSCLPNIEEDTFDLTSWFAGKGTCLTEGYPMNGRSEWAVELAKIKGILQHEHHIISTLQRKAASFCQLLTKQRNSQDQIEMLQLDPTASLLLHCALFDDSLDDQEYNPGTIGLGSFSSLRDKIFHVGNAALQLSIVSEIYHLYPTCTSGDMHLMKVVLMSHDSLAYIFVKSRFHECLFDTYADATIIMQDYMKESDLLGSKEWAKHDGWKISGGLGEFRRRIEQYYGDDGCSEMARPQYMGLAAGRLWGHTNKLPDAASDDLQFSMKCVVGALVLAFGVNDAWDILRPFFLELMLLSPEELRTSYMGVSDLVSCYKKGKK